MFLKELFFDFFLFEILFDDCFGITYRERRKTELSTISERERAAVAMA